MWIGSALGYRIKLSSVRLGVERDASEMPKKVTKRRDGVCRPRILSKACTGLHKRR